MNPTPSLFTKHGLEAAHRREHGLNAPDYTDRAAPPAADIPRRREDPDNPVGLPWTSRSIRGLTRGLWWPLTARGRAKAPLFYLLQQTPRFLPPPKQWPLAERLSCRARGAAIALWWPIGRLLTGLLCLRYRPGLRAELASWFERIAPHPHRRETPPPSSGPVVAAPPPPAPAPTTAAQPLDRSCGPGC
jgi:hypothetical protein